MKKQTIDVRRFVSGTQGEHRTVATITRTVHCMEVTAVQDFMAAFAPLSRRLVHWIEYAGDRWPVKMMDYTDKTTWTVMLPSYTERGAEELKALS